MEQLAYLFVLFIIYAFIGWAMEVVVVFIGTKELVNRGFLIGPLCPIYGCGSLLMITLLGRYNSNPVLLFIMAILICSILEYFTSYIMEKLFKARWWDYSDKKFHINGRICLENCLAFGLLGLLMIYFMNPFINGILDLIPSMIMYIISIILVIIFLTDLIISFKIISNFTTVAKSINKDSTSEITKKVREILIKRGGLYKRLIIAFNFEVSDKLIKNIKNIKSTVDRKVKEGIEETKKISGETIDKIKKIKK